MARKARRRSFGKIETKTNRHGNRYYQASYRTPVEAMAERPGLPERQYKNFDDETAANGWLSSEKRLMDAGVWTPVKEREAKARRSDVTFAEYSAQWVENRRKRDGSPLREGTRQKYFQYLRDHLNPVLGDKPMTSIRPADIRVWYDSMTVTRDGRGASVRRHVFDLLNGIMSDAASTPLDDEGTTLIPVTPVQFKVPRPDTLHNYVIASREQIWALADAMPPSHRLSVLIAGVMGLREGEVLGLQRGDVELGRSPAILHVRRSAKDGTVNGHKARVLGDLKTAGSRRDLEIPEPLLADMKRQLDNYVDSAPTALLFTGIRSRKIVSGQSIRNEFNRAKKAVGDPELMDMHFHDLRHSALTYFAQDGATVGQLMKLGGHTNLKTVAVYQQSSADADERLRNAVNAELSSAAPVPASPSSPASPRNGVPPSQDGGSDGLAGILAVMPLDERVAVIRELDAGKRQRALGLLPRDARVETMAALFEEEL